MVQVIQSIDFDRVIAQRSL